MERVGDILKRYIDSIKYLNENNQLNIFTGWEAIVGRKFFNHSKVVDIVNNTLIIEIDHPGWMQLFKMKEQEILNKIQKQYPETEVENIKIIVKFNRENS